MWCIKIIVGWLVRVSVKFHIFSRGGGLGGCNLRENISRRFIMDLYTGSGTVS